MDARLRLRPAQLAPLIGHDVGTIYRAIRRGLPHSKVGRSVYVSVDDWNAWLAKHSVVREFERKTLVPAGA